MIVLAAPVLAYLERDGPRAIGNPGRGRTYCCQFEIELIFGTEEEARTAREVWLSYRYLGLDK